MVYIGFPLLVGERDVCVTSSTSHFLPRPPRLTFIYWEVMYFIYGEVLYKSFIYWRSKPISSYPWYLFTQHNKLDYCFISFNLDTCYRIEKGPYSINTKNQTMGHWDLRCISVSCRPEHAKTVYHTLQVSRPID